MKFFFRLFINYLIVLSLFFAGSNVLYGKNQLGIYLGLKAGISVSDVPEGLQNAPAFSEIPDLKIFYKFPVRTNSPNYVLLEGGFATFPIAYKPYAYPENDWKEISSYLSVGAMLQSHFFLCGLELGWPIEVSSTKTIFGKLHEVNEINPLLAVKTGTNFNIVKNNESEINLYLIISYFLIKRNRDSWQFGMTHNWSPKPISLMLALSYEMALNE